MPLCFCPEGVNESCLCCGQFATKCCGPEREAFCSCLNNCCGILPNGCECCPFGQAGCLGFKNPLCGCCGNCNLMCYAGCCQPCFIADLDIASETDPVKAKKTWSATMCTLLSFVVVANILTNLGGMSPKLGFLRLIGQIVQDIQYVYMGIIFGKAVTRFAPKMALTYEPAECCTQCCSEEHMCCPGWNPCSCPNNRMGCFSECCLTYCCCASCHSLQVARAMEGTELVANITNGRPDECLCCNCWVAEKGGATGTQNNTPAV